MIADCPVKQGSPASVAVMKLPHYQDAVILESKITGYLLSGAQPKGRHKALSFNHKLKPHASRPPGWDAERVKNVLRHYEEQTEDEAVAGDEGDLPSPFTPRVGAA